MAGALIGEAFLSASIRTLCDKVSSGELVDFFRRKKLDHSLLEKLKLTLLTLYAVLNDAEEKQIVNPAVGMWLNELKHAVFDAEDLLDEIDAEVLRSKVEAEYQTKKTQVWNFLSTSLNPFYQGMNGRVQVIFERLEHLAKQKDLLGLIGGVKGTVSQRTPTTSFVEHEFSACGRERDEKELKRMLLSDNASSSHISVIPIVGMGGVGKTTLARVLYNDKKIKEHFDVTAWACVSEDFDDIRVTKTLIESIISKPCSLQDMSLLQVELREQVRGKKFLFVLDDLWNDKYSDWDLVRAPFTYGARGSKVIVTTRNKSVASLVHTGPIHYLRNLSDEDCWLLLSKHAFRNENPSAHPKLEEIGKQIAHKCDGLPLAAKALGGLLGCNVGYKEWSHILNNNLWETLYDKSVLPSLRLSYHYLPTYLKQCFAYLSIFPKDYEFEKENIIQLWMALGLIPQAESGQGLEELGGRYFDELLSRSLLQRSWKSSFTMHDLINDLAMSVSGEFCFRLGEGQPHEVPKRVRHLSYMRERFDTVAKFKPLDEIKCLRTLFPMSLRPYYKWDKSLYVSIKVLEDLLLAQRCLRVLSLARYKNITQLPDNIGKHLSLRYIDLSYTAVKTLPNTMCELYNLQTLLLLGCSSLVELPADMRKLINLRLLDIRETCIKEMPVQMGRLKSLSTLTAFVLGKSTRSSGIGELGQLSNLRGKLSILNLQNVVNPMDALGANLKDKKDLHEVELAWGHEDANDSVKERHVLESLQPSVNLVKLTIRFYGGTRFPDWLGDSSFSSIQVMHLTDCSTCLSLPPVGRLPALKELYIERMKIVVSIDVEFYGGNGASLSQPFQSLEKLVFKEMPEWEEWLSSPGSGQSCFPRLEVLILHNCPKLRGNLPDRLPCLRQLEVDECGVLHERATRTRWIPWSLIVNTESLRQSLNHLNIVRCPGLSSILETESLSSLWTLRIQNFSRTDCLQPHFSSCLASLNLVNCASLLSFPRNGLPTSLTYLRIQKCRRLEFLSHEMMTKLTSLQRLYLRDSCDSLRSFPLGVFPKLSNLHIWGSKNLESLSIGEGADDENLTHLDSLFIYDCPNLVSFPHGGLRTPKLARFIVWKCENLKLLPDRIHTLTALRDLRIYNLPNVESFAEGGLPPNLESFRIYDCEKLKPSVEYWGLQRLVSLRTFRIRKSQHLLKTVLKEQLLPTTLHGLEISGVNRLKSLKGKGLQHLTCLQELEITSCRRLKFLPKEGFPASLSFLSIQKCPSLRKRCREKTGKEWSKIAHIPCIEIDDQVII
ncbi:putative disease resistance RPP13-like protein 1 [Malus sylvestris]|uniref:putative disease resistance RPP13-like protein 1 n=1 Tax=Malus sylvestris TaxID=3752 RepID=UPI0021AD3D18|nr:putative disease resistance RPP13-like protein 1 [Malus sylvestris]XP_050153748.1 putative disease resistance RPP13-like protein 1 [Malus sylvestris]XP_050153749.1 putative disease resistance RPP13-like protein 1 [Malus sylvestris]XP_050153750.1 putative disease resistance RPP13-like protein 1 [Malus sylvestris]XP_050153751.1 putative disease resistance RPP13-like protein 1 [Malus sylvestris]XP_050153752.1 putative disease resistance RPP13-like protein 1 [Malus sylvestris]XP_050153753.1 pu